VPCARPGRGQTPWYQKDSCHQPPLQPKKGEKREDKEGGRYRHRGVTHSLKLLSTLRGRILPGHTSSLIYLPSTLRTIVSLSLLHWGFHIPLLYGTDVPAYQPTQAPILSARLPYQLKRNLTTKTPHHIKHVQSRDRHRQTFLISC